MLIIQNSIEYVCAFVNLLCITKITIVNISCFKQRTKKLKNLYYSETQL